MVSLIGLALLPPATTHIWRSPGAANIDTETLVRHVTALLTHGLSAGTPSQTNKPGARMSLSCPPSCVVPADHGNTGRVQQ
jgi:hypothetical protein